MSLTACLIERRYDVIAVTQFLANPKLNRWRNSNTSCLLIYKDQIQQGLALTYRCCISPVVFDVPANRRYVKVHTSSQWRLQSATSKWISWWRKHGDLDWSPILVAIFEPGCNAVFGFFKRRVGTSSSRVRAHFVRNCVLENNQVVSASFDKLIKNDCDWFAVDFGACMSPTSNKLSCDQELD